MSSKQGSPWTDGELLFLKENYKDMTHAEMAQHLGRTKTAVDLRLSRMGLKKSKYTYNVSFFNTIDTEEKAYWLGFIFADGYVRYIDTEDCRQHELGIELTASDYKHLQKFNRALNGNVQVTFRDRKVYWENINQCKTYKMCLIRFYSKKLTEPLLKYNLDNGKSATLTFPELDSCFIPAFIRGFFDGDGCICKDNNSKKYIGLDFCSESKGFLESIKSILYQYGIFSYLYQEKAYDDYSARLGDGEYKNTYRLKIKGVTNTSRMIHFLYDDACIYLDRKYEKAKSFLINYKLDERSLPRQSVMVG